MHNVSDEIDVVGEVGEEMNYDIIIMVNYSDSALN